MKKLFVFSLIVLTASFCSGCATTSNCRSEPCSSGVFPGAVGIATDVAVTALKGVNFILFGNTPPPAAPKTTRVLSTSTLVITPTYPVYPVYPTAYGVYWGSSGHHDNHHDDHHGGHHDNHHHNKHSDGHHNGGQKKGGHHK